MGCEDASRMGRPISVIPVEAITRLHGASCWSQKSSAHNEQWNTLAYALSVEMSVHAACQRKRQGKCGGNEGGGGGEEKLGEVKTRKEERSRKSEA